MTSRLVFTTTVSGAGIAVVVEPGFEQPDAWDWHNLQKGQEKKHWWQE